MNELNKFFRPESIQQALQMASEHIGHMKFLAGGTDLLVNKKQGNEHAMCLIDLTSIEELKQISLSDGNLRIGALMTLDSVARHALLVKACTSISETIETIASPVIRLSATIGGNLLCENRCSFYNQSEWWRKAVGYCLKCNGEFCIATGGKNRCFSKFSSDLAITLISLDSKLHFVNENGTSVIPLENIYTGDGVHPRNITAGTLLTAIEIPLHQEFKSVYRKLRPRQSMDFSSLTSAVSLDKDSNVRIALGGVDPMPVVAKGPLDQKAELIRKVIKRSRIVDNDMYSRSYRKKMISIFLERSFEELLTGDR